LNLLDYSTSKEPIVRKVMNKTILCSEKNFTMNIFVKKLFQSSELFIEITSVNDEMFDTSRLKEKMTE
jgi:hypothetical protein